MPERVPLRVRWTLREYMLQPEHPIHLDGILHDVCDGAIDFLGVEHQGDDWCYQASLLHFRGAILRHARAITRRHDIGDHARLRRTGLSAFKGEQLDNTNGTWRNYLVTQRLILPEAIEAFCVADEAALRAAVERISHLGGERRLGFGEIASCEVTPADPDAWRARVTPWQTASAVRLVTTTHPPYWRRDRRQPGYLPVEAADACLA